MVANKLKALRKQKGLTLEELAASLGTSKQTIHRYENGVIANIPKEKIERLAELLGTTPSELMGWGENLYSYDNIIPIKKKILPIVGTISCGTPIYAEEEYGSFAIANTDLDATFCLRAKGDSMTGARIFDGDLVFLRAFDGFEFNLYRRSVVNFPGVERPGFVRFGASEKLVDTLPR